MEAGAEQEASVRAMQRGKGIFEAIMTLQSPDYWYGRLDNLIEFKHRCKAFQEVLSVFPDDYIALQKELTKAINQNELNMLWIRQEIATREELQDYPGATA